MSMHRGVHSGVGEIFLITKIDRSETIENHSFNMSLKLTNHK